MVEVWRVGVVCRRIGHGPWNACVLLFGRVADSGIPSLHALFERAGSANEIKQGCADGNKDYGANCNPNNGVSGQSVAARSCCSRTGRARRSVERRRRHIAFFGYRLPRDNHDGRVFGCYNLLVQRLGSVGVDDTNHFVVETRAGCSAVVKDGFCGVDGDVEVCQL